MPDFEDIAVVLLAAGQSVRFGAADKLEQALDGVPLGLHAARSLAPLPFNRKFAVCGARRGIVPDGLAAAGFEIVVNPDPARGQGISIALGARAAAEAGAAAVLICLADMPYISAALVLRLIAAWRAGPDRVVATGSDGYRGVPAIFPRAHFSALIGLAGDRGAKALLDGAVLVEAPAAELRDFDRPEDFAGTAEKQ